MHRQLLQLIDAKQFEARNGTALAGDRMGRGWGASMSEEAPGIEDKLLDVVGSEAHAAETSAGRCSAGQIGPGRVCERQLHAQG